jgi:site-specific recombinase XerD
VDSNHRPQSYQDCSLLDDCKSHSISLNQNLNLWQSELEFRGLSKLTIDSYRQKVEDLLDFNSTPDELIIKSFLANMQRAGTSTGTIANYVKAFRSLFNYLYESRLYDYDASRLKQPKIKYQERRVPKDDDIVELMRMLNTAEDTIALLLLIDCGIRITELATIKIDDIDFNESSILIHGKGGKTRIVYISEPVVKQLRHYVGTLKSDQLFPSTRSDAKVAYRGRRYFERRLDELCKRAGVERLTPHQLRHYFATTALSRGADIKAVSEFLGHSDVTITLKIYHHVNAKAIRQMHSEYSPLVNTRLALPTAV